MQNLADTSNLSMMHDAELNKLSHRNESGLLIVPKPYFSSPQITLYHGDTLKVLSSMATNSIDCIVTSPPYYGKRDYGIDGQLGLEDHPQIYIDKLIGIFREAWRILKPTGSLWVNIGDTYWSGKGRSRGVD